MQKGIIGSVVSVNSVTIRLTYERWFHISGSHPELIGKHYDVFKTISHPNLIVQGKSKEYLALRKIGQKYLVVIYKEINKKDGFVITAFYTKNLKSILKKRKIIWKNSKI